MYIAYISILIFFHILYTPKFRLRWLHSNTSFSAVVFVGPTSKASLMLLVKLQLENPLVLI